MFIFLFAFFFQFYPVINQDGKVPYSASSLFMLTTTRSGHLVEMRGLLLLLLSPLEFYTSALADGLSHDFE